MSLQAKLSDYIWAWEGVAFGSSATDPVALLIYQDMSWLTMRSGGTTKSLARRMPKYHRISWCDSPLEVLVPLIAIQSVAVVLGAQLVLLCQVANSAACPAGGQLEQVPGREGPGSEDVRVHDHVEWGPDQGGACQLHQLLRLLQPRRMQLLSQCQAINVVLPARDTNKEHAQVRYPSCCMRLLQSSSIQRITLVEAFHSGRLTIDIDGI